MIENTAHAIDAVDFIRQNPQKVYETAIETLQESQIPVLQRLVKHHPSQWMAYMWSRPDEMGRLMSLIIAEQGKKQLAMISTVLLLSDCPNTWQNIDVSLIPLRSRFFVVANFAKVGITQEIINYLICVDIPDSTYRLVWKEEVLKPPSEFPGTDANKWFDSYTLDDNLAKLARGFTSHVLLEAAPYNRNRIPLGGYLFYPPEEATLNHYLKIDHIRLYFTPQGIYGSIVHDNCYSPFFFSPDEAENMVFTLGSKIGWALQTMLACLWRDAIVVQYRFMHDTAAKSERDYQTVRKSRQKEHRKKLMLPRKIRIMQWGSSVTEREYIERKVHGVRAHYRELPDGWKPSEVAKETAQDLGYPPPPDGFTFVAPHKRGQGEIDPVEVVCKGMVAAKIIFKAVGEPPTGHKLPSFEILQDLNQFFNMADLAIIFQVTRERVRQVFEENGIQAERHHLTHDEILDATLSHLPKPKSLAKLRKLYTVSEIADMFGLEESILYKIFRKMKIVFPPLARPAPERRLFDYAEAWRMYNEDKMSIEEIAVHFSRPRVTIYHAFRRHYGWSDPRRNKP